MSDCEVGAMEDMMAQEKPEWVKHIIEEGSRNHVIRYIDGVGAVCSVPNCERNQYRTQRGTMDDR